MKKPLLSILFILFFSISSIAQESENKLFRFKTNNLFGFINQKGEIIVEPQYTTVGLFSEGLCAVVKRENNESKLGYIDYHGEVVIPLQYQQYLYWGSDFSDGRAAVRLDDKSGYINTKGEIIFQASLYKAHPFHNGFAVIEKDYGIRSVINKEGKIVFDPIEAYKRQRANKPVGKELLYLNDKVNNGVITFAVTFGSSYPSTQKMGYFKMNGEMVFPLNYLTGNYQENLVQVYNADRTKAGYLDKKGNTAIPLKFKTVSDFYNGKALVKDINTNKYGIIDNRGNYIIQPNYRHISKYFYKSDIIMVRNDSGKTGYINAKGEPISEFKYEYGLDFSEGFAFVYSRANGCEFIDKTGESAFDLDFDSPSNYLNASFSGGLAKIRMNKKNAYINTKGEVVFTYE
ncbi:WG repeat-containing protein [Winogradskyella sp. PE311]|uniref:WG repeat-containing protein n=1 Tax=Winogradskyella sp. PE311 TaxID=3366943 RepID=UPI00397F4240